MKLIGLENVVFVESYILGWAQDTKSISIYMEVHLTKFHKNFTNFDKKTEFGCYKLAILELLNVTNVIGLVKGCVEPQWDSSLPEFQAITEINEVGIIRDEFVIDTDDGDIRVKCDVVKLTILEDETENAFKQ